MRYFMELMIGLCVMVIACLLIGTEATVAIALGIMGAVAVCAIVCLVYEFVEFLIEKRRGSG